MYKYLKQFADYTETLVFNDHYSFKNEDITKIMLKFESIDSANKIIITTEKDAMRLKDLANLTDEFKNELYYLPVKVKFLDNEGKEFNKKIFNYVGENKSNRELHKRKNRRES